MRLNKFIAKNTSYSRQKADELIKNGKIKVSGRIITDPKTEINYEKVTVRMGAKVIKEKNTKIYLLLNKPKGYLTTLSDELKRRTVMDLIPTRQNLRPVGRLDMETEGVLVFSNDGTFINQLGQNEPKFQKEYNLIVEGKISDKEKEKLIKAFSINQPEDISKKKQINKKTKKMKNKKKAKTEKSDKAEETNKNLAKINILKSNKKETMLSMIIPEGRNRQIREIFATIHHPIKYLQRTRIGNIRLGSLKRGKYRLLTQEEIQC